VGDICEHLLEKIWSILVARSLQNEAMNWWHCCWAELAGRERVYLNSME
jgi:hypothetical protein